MSFSIGDISVALAIAIAVGLAVISGFNTQKAGSSPAVVSALRRRMGSLYTVTLFASAALPTVAILFVASLRNTPTLLDILVIVILIGLGMIAGFTVLANAMLASGEVSAGPGQG